MRILIAEDDAATAAHLSRLLHEWGYEVGGVAASCVEALRLAAWHWPDLALINLYLSGPENGTELAARLRAQRACPVLFLSGAEPEDFPPTLLQQSGVMLLEKPFYSPRLRFILEVMLAAR
jgi:DNA-binding response OmpR family regulator